MLKETAAMYQYCGGIDAQDLTVWYWTEQGESGYNC